MMTSVLTMPSTMMQLLLYYRQEVEYGDAEEDMEDEKQGKNATRETGNSQEG